MMSVQKAVRGGLTLHVNDAPQFSNRRSGVCLATEGGVVVDAFALGVSTLVGRLKQDHDRILAGDPGEGPDVLLTIPANCTRDEIAAAKKALKDDGWEVWPGALRNDHQIYLGYYGA